MNNKYFILIFILIISSGNIYAYYHYHFGATNQNLFSELTNQLQSTNYNTRLTAARYLLRQAQGIEPSICFPDIVAAEFILNERNKKIVRLYYKVIIQYKQSLENNVYITGILLNTIDCDLMTPQKLKYCYAIVSFINNDTLMMYGGLQVLEKLHECELSHGW